MFQWLDNDFSYLSRESITAEDAESALKCYIWSIEKGLKVPAELQEFILKGLRRQILDGAGGWCTSKAGRPKNSSANTEELSRWAWYCYHFEPEFARGDKRGENVPSVRHDKIAEHLHKVFVSLRVKAPGLSGESVRRYIGRFTKSGFRRTNSDTSPIQAQEMDEMNFAEARAFCVGWLDMERAYADSHAREIVEYWKKQGQK